MYNIFLFILQIPTKEDKYNYVYNLSIRSHVLEGTGNIIIMKHDSTRMDTTRRDGL